MDLAATTVQATLATPLAVLSVVLAAATAYATLEFADRLTGARGWAWSVWLAGGATATGAGIWSANYVGLVAARLPLPVWYDWRIVFASLVAAIGSAGATLYVLSRRHMRLWQLVGGAAVMGGGVAATHYASRAAMRLAATSGLDPVLVAVSIAIAVMMSLAGIWLWARAASAERALRWRVACALVLGAAAPALDSIGMAAAYYLPSTGGVDLSHTVNGSILGAIAVWVVSLIVLGLAVLTSLYDRRLSFQREALRSAERRYRHLFQRSPAGMIRVARDGRIVDSNLAAARMFGFDTADALMATPMTDRYFDLADRAPLLARFAAERQVTDMELRMRRKDGSPVWLLATVTTAESSESDVPAYDSMLIDITDKKRLEVELLHARKLEAVGGLAAGIAHEINTPVQFVTDNARFIEESVTGVTELIGLYEQLATGAAATPAAPEVLHQINALRERLDWAYLRAEIPKALEQMQEGLVRVSRIVGAMKEFARVDHRGKLVAVDLNKALESTLTVARNEFKYVAEVTTEFGVLPPVPCYAADLNQVFLNLVINAAHAIEDVVSGTATLGRITIRTRQAGEWAEIDMSDTGTGIPLAIRDKVFEPFFTTKEVGRGSGQGLTLARAIVVEKHGGMLTFESEVGKGTTIHVRLPMRPPGSIEPPLAA